MADNFNNGFNSTNFVVLKQKGSLLENVEIVTDKVDGIEKNVLKLAMHAEGTGDAWHVYSGAVVQTRDFFASGRYEVRAKVPRVEGMIWALWTFHYETHYDVAHLPAGKYSSEGACIAYMEAL